MSSLLSQFTAALPVATLALAAAVLLMGLLLRYSQAASPAVHRRVWCAVLIAGWSFVQLPISIPWYPAEPESVAVVDTSAAPDRSLADDADDSAADARTVVADLPLEPQVAVPFASDEPTRPSPAAFDSPEPEPLATAPAALTEFPPREVRAAGTVPSATAVSRIDVPLTLAVAWVGGMAGIVLAWVAGYLWFVVRLPRGLEGDPIWLEEWRALLAAHHVCREIPLRVTNQLGPLLCRLPRGYELVVPAGLWRQLDAVGRATILRHELAHYQHGDVWNSLAIRVLALPQWFNPCSWFAVRRFDEAAEWACDRVVAAEHSVTDYARALLQLGTDPHGYASYRPAASGKPLAARVRRLLRLPNERDSRCKAAILIASALALAVVSLVRIELVAQEPPAAENPVAEAAATPVAQPESPQPKHNRLETVTVVVDKSADSTPGVTPAQATTEAAQKAYEANLAAYKANQGTLDAVYIWSQRWQRAAERSPMPVAAGAPAPASTQEHRAAAAKEHLARMQKLRERVKALHEVAAHGGEHARLMEVDFYVTEAEQRVAEIATESKRLTAAPSPRIPAMVVPKAARPGEAPVVTVNNGIPQRSWITLQLSDPGPIRVDESSELKILVTNIGNRNSQRLTITYQPPPAIKASLVTQGYELKSAGDTIRWELTDLKPGEQKEFVILYRGLFRDDGAKQRVILRDEWEGAELRAEAVTPVRTAAIEVRLPFAPSAAPRDNPAALPAVPVAAPQAPSPPMLRYQGKSFAEWSAILTTELSEEGQIEAIKAMGAFAAKGSGEDAARLLIDLRPERLTTIEFHVVAALHGVPKDDKLKVCGELLRDNHPETRRLALIGLASAAAESPKFREALDVALHDIDPMVVETALRIVAGKYAEKEYYFVPEQVPAMPELAPEIAAILADEIEDVEQGKSNDVLRRPEAAIRALVRCGPAAKAAFPTVLPWLTGSDPSKFDWGMRIVEASGAEGAEAVSFLAESLTTIRTHKLEAKSAATRGFGGGPTSPTLRVLAALGELGPKANAALPKLETFLLEQTSDDSQVATATREAIKRIRPPVGDQSPEAPK